jgi:hypothetical protein
MLPEPLALDWQEISIQCADAAELGSALDCLKGSHAADQYGHLTVPMLMRKMVPRKHGANCVHGLRVFWRRGPTDRRHRAVFYFARFRVSPPELCMTVGVGEDVSQATISSDLRSICGYMQGQPLGARQVLLSQGNPPTTQRPELNAAFQAALNANPAALVYDGLLAPDPPPWPYQLHRWRIIP